MSAKTFGEAGRIDEAMVYSVLGGKERLDNARKFI